MLPRPPEETDIDPWLWVTVIVVAVVGVPALVWWSSGRARPRGRDLERHSAEERYQLDVNRMSTMRNRDEMGPRI